MLARAALLRVQNPLADFGRSDFGLDIARKMVYNADTELCF
jgi:hypothetical protein